MLTSLLVAGKVIITIFKTSKKLHELEIFWVSQIAPVVTSREQSYPEPYLGDLLKIKHT